LRRTVAVLGTPSSRPSAPRWDVAGFAKDHARPTDPRAARHRPGASAARSRASRTTVLFMIDPTGHSRLEPRGERLKGLRCHRDHRKALLGYSTLRGRRGRKCETSREASAPGASRTRGGDPQGGSRSGRSHHHVLHSEQGSSSASRRFTRDWNERTQLEEGERPRGGGGRGARSDSASGVPGGFLAISVTTSATDRAE